MIQKRNKEILGIILVLVGLLFLLANYHVLWFRWEAIWPIFLLLGGSFLLKLFASSKSAELLFGGLVSLFLGFFFLLFTVKILPWKNLETLWPTFPLIGGISLLAVSGVKKNATGSVVVGLAAVIFSVACYAYTSDLIGSRAALSFIRLWPLVLIGSGALVFLRARNEITNTAPMLNGGEKGSAGNSGKNESEGARGSSQNN